jgi:RNA polymerase sigma factor (sigma-70 family)
MHDWKEIRQRYGALIFGAAYRILKRHDQALDCYQEVFLEAFEQCEARPVRNWPALLRWMTVRRALDRLRKERRIAARVEPDNDTSLLPAPLESPGDDIEFRELTDRVRAEIARLPERQGEAFWLRCIEQMSSAEVAEQLGTDANSVGVLVHRARARLCEMLADVNPARVE